MPQPCLRSLKPRSLRSTHGGSSYGSRKVKSKIPKLRYMPRFHPTRTANSQIQDPSTDDPTPQTQPVSSRTYQRKPKHAEGELAMHRRGNSCIVAQACAGHLAKRPISPHLEATTVAGQVTPLQLEEDEEAPLASSKGLNFTDETQRRPDYRDGVNKSVSKRRLNDHP